MTSILINFEIRSSICVFLDWPLYNILNEVIKVVHCFSLVIAQQLLVFRHLVKYSSHSVTPFVKQVLLVLLDIHELVHNVELKVEFLAVDGVLGWVVEVELEASHCEVSDIISSFH